MQNQESNYISINLLYIDSANDDEQKVVKPVTKEES
jgi:hypothetical protein